MAELRKIGVWSLAKIQAIISFSLVLILMVALYLLYSVANMFLATEMPFEPIQIIIMPLTYVFVGLAMGSLTAALYNWVVKVKWIGPLKIEIKK